MVKQQLYVSTNKLTQRSINFCNSRLLVRLVVFTVLVCGGVNERYDQEWTCKKVQKSVITMANPRGRGKIGKPVSDHSGEVKT